MKKEIFNSWLCGVRGDFKQQGRKLFRITHNCAARSNDHPRAVRHRINNINVIQLFIDWKYETRRRDI